MSDEPMKVTVNDEALGNSFDLLGQIQRRQMDALIAHERAELAASCGDYVAWMAYPPTRHDDPAEYAPYWTRLKDVASEEQLEAATAALLRQRPGGVPPAQKEQT